MTDGFPAQWITDNFDIFFVGTLGKFWSNSLVVSRNISNELIAEIILGIGSANERRRYFVTSSLIGCAHNKMKTKHSVHNWWDIIYAVVWSQFLQTPLQWRHNDHDGVSNHQPHCCLLNCLFRRGSKKTSKLRVTGLCVGNSLGPVNSPNKGPVTLKMFPFDDVIMTSQKTISSRIDEPTNYQEILGCEPVDSYRTHFVKWLYVFCVIRSHWNENIVIVTRFGIVKWVQLVTT